jgi:hypothetical protein
MTEPPDVLGSLKEDLIKNLKESGIMWDELDASMQEVSLAAYIHGYLYGKKQSESNMKGK